METLVKAGAIGSVLLGSGMITEADIEAALEEQKRTGCRFGEALVRLGKISQEDVDWALSSQLNIPYVRLNPEMIDKCAVGMVPESVARKYSLIPIFLAGDEISIALADPLNREAIGVVEQITGCRVTVSIPIMSELKDMLDLFYGPADSAKTFGFSSRVFRPEMLEAVNRDTGGGSFLDCMLQHILENGLRSISLQPLADSVSVVGRHRGSTVEIGRLAGEFYPALLALIRERGKVRGHGDVSAKGVIGFNFRGEEVRFQVLILNGPDGDYITFRIHVPIEFPGNLGQMGLSEEKLRAVREIVSAGQGIVLFASGTAEERSGIIDLFLGEYDTSDKTVMVLDDGTGNGIRRFPRISFRKDSRDGLESALAAVLEHEPDMIVLEDIGCCDPPPIAALAAGRGKLVLCGVPLRDSAEALEYLMSHRRNGELFSQIRGLVVFRAVMAPCPACARTPGAGQPAESDNGPQGRPGLDPSQGCPACGYTGISGRKFLVDVIPITGETAKVLSSTETVGEVLEYIVGKGYGSKLTDPARTDSCSTAGQS